MPTQAQPFCHLDLVTRGGSEDCAHIVTILTSLSNSSLSYEHVYFSIFILPASVFQFQPGHMQPLPNPVSQFLSLGKCWTPLPYSSSPPECIFCCLISLFLKPQPSAQPSSCAPNWSREQLLENNKSWKLKLQKGFALGGDFCSHRRQSLAEVPGETHHCRKDSSASSVCIIKLLSAPLLHCQQSWGICTLPGNQDKGSQEALSGSKSPRLCAAS